MLTPVARLLAVLALLVGVGVVTAQDAGAASSAPGARVGVSGIRAPGLDGLGQAQQSAPARAAGQAPGAPVALTSAVARGGASAVPPSPAVTGVAGAGASNPCGGSAYACADGYFRIWNGNNGQRCDYLHSTTTLGQCTNTDYLFGNTGYRCSGCDWVRLYWGSSYTGAYYCIPPGYTYGQPTTPNLTFNKGKGLSGYGQSVWRNAASAQWTGAC